VAASQLNVSGVLHLAAYSKKCLHLMQSQAHSAVFPSPEYPEHTEPLSPLIGEQSVEVVVVDGAVVAVVVVVVTGASVVVTFSVVVVGGGVAIGVVRGALVVVTFVVVAAIVVVPGGGGTTMGGQPAGTGILHKSFALNSQAPSEPGHVGVHVDTSKNPSVMQSSAVQ
jgi:hypothetical protein